MDDSEGYHGVTTAFWSPVIMDDSDNCLLTTASQKCVTRWNGERNPCWPVAGNIPRAPTISSGGGWSPRVYSSPFHMSSR